MNASTLTQARPHVNVKTFTHGVLAMTLWCRYAYEVIWYETTVMGGTVTLADWAAAVRALCSP